MALLQVSGYLPVFNILLLNTNQLITINTQAIYTSGAHFERIQIYLKFPYHKGSNIYLQPANFIIESLKSTFVLTTRHIHFTEVRGSRST